MAWTTPRTWVAGEVVTAALLNTHLRDNLNAIGGAWTSYTPTWTGGTSNPTIGNGSVIGKYCQAGKLVHYRARITWGTTTTDGSGGYTLTIPVACVASHIEIGRVFIRNSAGTIRLHKFARSISTTEARMEGEDGTLVDESTCGGWGSGDTLDLNGTYEAA